MRLSFLALPPDERRLYIEQAATQPSRNTRCDLRAHPLGASGADERDIAVVDQYLALIRPGDH